MSDSLQTRFPRIDCISVQAPCTEHPRGLIQLKTAGTSEIAGDGDVVWAGSTYDFDKLYTQLNDAAALTEQLCGHIEAQPLEHLIRR